MRARSWRGVGVLIIGVLIGAGLAAFDDRPADALTGSEFDPGYIISDENFYNSSAMSEAEIQRFLENAVGGTCHNANCLAVYRTDTPTRTWSFGTCSTYVGGASESAARIIFKVQQACSLSAKVILVTLQKEQSLVTNRAPSDGVMRKAMGYGCPDTAACDSTYYGFFNQLFAAGRQLTWYGNPAGSFTSIRIGEHNPIRYHPNSACGTKDVVVRNRATAALYYYTPYTPNAAALANLGGLGDSCSAYGNRNFWVFYNNWFGAPAGNPNPFGNVELIAAQPGSYRVVGWAIDPDSGGPVGIHVYVGGVGTATVADKVRGDVGAAYPSFGSAHGFDATVPATGSGDVSVCVYAINIGAGANVLLTCKTVTAMSGQPVGAMTATATPSGVDVSGWAIDPDITGPIAVHVYVDAVGVALTASRDRGDIGSAYAAYGRAHGFAASIPASPGTRQVCAYGINTGPGANVALGCSTVVVPGGAISEQGRPPTGVLESATSTGTGVNVKGWAIDPDTAAPIPVHVYVGATGKAITADVSRSDLPAGWAAYGPKHGFSADLPTAPGRYNVCAYAINTVGAPVGLGCRDVVVEASGTADLNRPPFGNVEVIGATTGLISVSGWAIDPDTAAPIDVHVYIGSDGAAVHANAERPDVGAAYPAYGSMHGFSFSKQVAPGSHGVCVYAINNGAGGHTPLRCATVTVPAPTVDMGRAPLGNLETAVRAPAGLSVSGWAFDPDTRDPIDVHVYVDAIGTAVRADIPRGDVEAAYRMGANHGFAATVPASMGPHRVCAYGINTGAGGHTLIGCIDVP